MWGAVEAAAAYSGILLAPFIFGKAPTIVPRFLHTLYTSSIYYAYAR